METRRHRLGAAICALMGCMAVFSGCTGKPPSLLGDDGVSRRARAIFEDQTSVRTETFSVAVGDLPQKLCMSIRVRRGSVSWHLLGPETQNARGDGTAEGTRVYHVSHCIELAAGAWELVLNLDDASGEYEVGWYVPGSEPSVATHLHD